MTLELVETFLTILKYRNISAAAQRLYTSQSTVSHRLQLLEQEVGVPLFTRHKGHRIVELTPGGEEFLPIAERWMSVFRDTGNIKNQTLRHTLHVGAVDMINTYTFVPLYQQQLLNAPHIHLTVRTYHSGELYSLLENRAIDIGFVYSQRHFPHILSTPLYREQMVVLCHKGSVYHPGLHVQELPPELEIYLRWSDEYELWHDRWWPAGKSLLTVGTGAQLPLYLDEPGRWAIAPASVYAALRNSEAITCYDLLEGPPPMFCYEIVHRYPKPSAEASIESFRQAVRAFIHDSDALCPFEPKMP